MAKDRIILKGTENTGFRYRIDGGMDERDKDEIEAMDSGYVLGHNWPKIVSESVDMRHRMGYIRRRNLGFAFLEIPDQQFRDFMNSIDRNLITCLAYMVADFYRNGTQCVSDLLENVSRKNPAGFENVMGSKYYYELFRRFMSELGEDVSNIKLKNIFFDRIPADVFGCASIYGDKVSGYRTDLILQIVLKA